MTTKTNIHEGDLTTEAGKVYDYTEITKGAYGAENFAGFFKVAS